MDCCAPKKDIEKNESEMETTNQTETCKKESSHGGCCGGGNMKLHLLLMFVVFAVVWYFTGR
ncbi:MAG: hypothetical protein Q8M95_11930 [Candidatus Methanoperedens sp.]|nr:hypothetical protein [Candidatus Methanoperedens sp.]